MIKFFTKPGTITIALHVLIWSLLILLPYLVSNADDYYKVGDIPGVFFSISGFIHAAIFYGNAFFLYPVLLNKRFWWLYILLALLLILGSFQLKYAILIRWFPEMLNDTIATRFVYGPSVVIFIVSMVYRKVIDQNWLEHQIKEKQTAQLETELKFLRSQINPHFMFNVLTSLVSLARKKSDKLEQSLLMLSDLMRYTVYDAKDKKVSLQREIEYLGSYIALQKLRFGNEVKFDYSPDLSENDFPIEPMLLIPFVENAFKHGTDYSEQSRIDITLSLTGATMTFEVSNRYEPSAPAGKDGSVGIGISNVRSRLQLLYENKHNLVIIDKNNIFHVILTLILA